MCLYCCTLTLKKILDWVSPNLKYCQGYFRSLCLRSICLTFGHSTTHGDFLLSLLSGDCLCSITSGITHTRGRSITVDVNVYLKESSLPCLSFVFSSEVIRSSQHAPHSMADPESIPVWGSWSAGLFPHCLSVQIFQLLFLGTWKGGSRWGSILITDSPS